MSFLLAQSPFCFFRALIFTIAVTISTFYVSSAQPPVFTPAATDVALLNTLFSKSEKQYLQEIEGLPAKSKKDFAELYKQQWDNVKEKFDTREIYTSAAAQRYLDALVAEIVQSNPALQKRPFSCYFSRSGVPNASYIGEGVILFNMGLFDKLDNESQAAFVLCHELAHFFLNHSENSIKKYVNTVNSKEVQQVLHKINASEYKKREELEKLVKGLTFDTRRHSRDHESEADSMAIEFMRGTRFNLQESLTTLALLDSIDTDTFHTDASLKQLFNAKGYPFQNKWIAKEEGLLGGHAKLKPDEQMEDSLKTHPDCKTRIKILSSLVHKYPAANGAKDIIDKTTFAKLQNDFRYEVIEWAFARENYTRSFFYTLQLLQAHPTDPYLVTQTGKILNGLFNAQKTHTLGKVTSLPAPSYPANYNLLLQFIQNLYKEDYASISYHFLNQYHPQFDYYHPFTKEYNTSIQIAQQ